MNTTRPATGLLATLAAAGLCSAALVPSTPSDGWTSTSMKHRALKDFDYVLAQERWRSLDSEIALFGADFPVDVLGPMRFEIDSNGDGKPDHDVKGDSGFVDLKGKDDAGEVFHYGVRFRNDGERKWSWTASGVMTGKVEGLTLSIIDANANGRYNDYGVDGLVVGKARGAGYVSKIVNIGGSLFELEVDRDGTEVRTRPYAGETGVLKLEKIKGIKADVVTAIARSSRSVSFQLAGSKKGVLVPVGDYALADAFLQRGSETARVRKGRMDDVAVASGETIGLRLGGPLSGEVPAPRMVGEKVTLSPNVQVFGALGEEYYDFQPKGKAPSFELHDAKTGKRLEKGTFPAG